MGFLDKARKKAEEEAKKAAEVTKKLSEQVCIQNNPKQKCTATLSTTLFYNKKGIWGASLY